MQTIDDCLRAGMSEPIIFEELEAERLAYPKARQPELTKDERRERANVLRSGGRQTTETQPGIVEREISESTDMLNFILARAKVPANERATVLALVGACQEKARPGEEGEWFELNDFELGLRLRCDSEDKPDEFMSKEERQSFADRERLTTGQWRARYETRRAARIQKHAQRRRKSLVEWQTEHGYQFVICAPGGKKGDEHFPSRYRVPLLVEAAEALTQAREKRSYNIKHPEKALRAEAKLALQRLEGTSPIVERFRRKGRQPKNVIDSNHRLILTKFQRNLELETRIDNDPVEYYESLISDLTKIMTGHGFAVSSSPFVHIHEREYGQKNSDESGPQIDQFEVDKSVHLDETDNPLSNQTLTAKSSKNNLQNENAQVPDYQQLDEEALDALFEDEKRASVAAFNSRAVLQELADLGYDKVARDRMKPEEAIQRRAYAATGD
jgi:FtsZ-binding cell division protein ZapB